MAEITRRIIEVGGLRMRVAEAGNGPLIVLLHGFPEFWFSWRHQLDSLAEAGFHVVAPDQRGYAGTDRPERIEQYTILHLVGDVLGLLDALGEADAIIVGHDWGAPVAWHTAQFRPDRVRGVVGMSVPHRPRGSTPPTEAMRAAFGERFYMNYFQQPGLADAELAADVEGSMRGMLYGLSGEFGEVRPLVVPEGERFADIWDAPDRLPDWLGAEVLAEFVATFRETGFTGGLNWYRNLDRNWELTAAWHRANIVAPALFIAGERDPVIAGRKPRRAVEGMREFVPNLTRSVLLDGCGHWCQQERPSEVSAELIAFAESLA